MEVIDGDEDISRLQRGGLKERLLSQKDFLYGVLLLLVVVFLWTSSNFVTQVSYVEISPR